MEQEHLYEIDPVSREENDRLAMELSRWLNEGRQKLEARMQSKEA